MLRFSHFTDIVSSVIALTSVPISICDFATILFISADRKSSCPHDTPHHLPLCPCFKKQGDLTIELIYVKFAYVRSSRFSLLLMFYRCAILFYHLYNCVCIDKMLVLNRYLWVKMKYGVDKSPTVAYSTKHRQLRWYPCDVCY